MRDSEDQRLVDGVLEGLCLAVEHARAKMQGLARRNVFLEERRRVQDAALRQALTVLEEAEWSGGGGWCTWCSTSAPHAEGCALDAALKAVREALGTPSLDETSRHGVPWR